MCQYATLQCHFSPTVSFQPYSVISTHVKFMWLISNTFDSFQTRLDCFQPSIDDPLCHVATASRNLLLTTQIVLLTTRIVLLTTQSSSWQHESSDRQLLSPTLDHFHQRSTTPPFNTRYLLNRIANRRQFLFILFRVSQCRNKNSPILSMAPF